MAGGLDRDRVHRQWEEIREVVLQFGNVEVPCEYGLARPDVAARFPGQPAAAAGVFGAQGGDLVGRPAVSGGLCPGARGVQRAVGPVSGPRPMRFPRPGRRPGGPSSSC